MPADLSSPIPAALAHLIQTDPRELQDAEAPHLLAYLAAVPDPRASRGRRHRLVAILTMAAVSSGPQVAMLLIAYCIGLGVPFIVLAIAADRTTVITRSLARHGRTIELIGGALVVALGVAILFDWLAMFSNAFVALWPQV